MPKRKTKSVNKQNTTFLNDSEQVEVFSGYITMNRETLVSTSNKINDICERLKDKNTFDGAINDLEKMRDSYLKIGQGGL